MTKENSVTPKTINEAEDGEAVRCSALLGVADCGLHRRTPYGMTNVSMTQLSIARHYGGCKYQGESYTYLPHTDELIRDDVLKWKRKHERKRKTPNGESSDLRPVSVRHKEQREPQVRCDEWLGEAPTKSGARARSGAGGAGAGGESKTQAEGQTYE